MSLVKAKKEIAEVKAENARLKQTINLNIYNHDDLEQYNRRENIRIYGVPESSEKKEDGEQILLKIADELSIKQDNWDIQRCHRLRKKPRNGSYENSNNGKTKSRPIIVMFRHELLNYVKTKCNHRFVMCHSYNGKIKMKKAGKEKGKWIIVTSPDGLSIYSSNIDEHRD